MSALGSLTFSVLLLLGAIGRDDAASGFLAMARGRSAYPAVLDVPARLLADWSLGGSGAAELPSAGALLAGAAAGLAIVSMLYRRAWGNAQRAVLPLRRRGIARPWPASATAVVFRKELAQIAQQPGQLLGLLVSTLFVVVLAGSRLFGRELFAEQRLPADEQAVFVLMATWLVAQVTIVPGSVLRVALLDGPQWQLYVLAPASRAAILRGKLLSIALLQAWPAAIAAIVGRVQLGASVAALATFGALVPVAVLWASSVSVWVGTIPGLIRPGPERNPVLALVAVALAIFLLQLTAVPGAFAWLWLVERQAGAGPLAGMSTSGAHAVLIGAAQGVGLLASAAALALAGRQLRRLTRPEH